MSARYRQYLQGIETLNKELAAFSSAVKSQAVGAGLLQAMKEVKATAIAYQQMNLTGRKLNKRQAVRPRLADGIEAKVVTYENAVFAIVGPQHKFRHGWLLERGHNVVVRTDRGPRYKQRKGRVYEDGRMTAQTKVAARPFIKPASDQHSSQIVVTVSQGIDKTIRNFNRRAARAQKKRGGANG